MYDLGGNISVFKDGSMRDDGNSISHGHSSSNNAASIVIITYASLPAIPTSNPDLDTNITNNIRPDTFNNSNINADTATNNSNGNSTTSIVDTARALNASTPTPPITMPAATPTTRAARMSTRRTAQRATTAAAAVSCATDFYHNLCDRDTR